MDRPGKAAEAAAGAAAYAHTHTHAHTRTHTHTHQMWCAGAYNSYTEAETWGEGLHHASHNKQGAQSHAEYGGCVMCTPTPRQTNKTQGASSNSSATTNTESIEDAGARMLREEEWWLGTGPDTHLMRTPGQPSPPPPPPPPGRRQAQPPGHSTACDRQGRTDAAGTHTQQAAGRCETGNNPTLHQPGAHVTPALPSIASPPLTLYLGDTLYSYEAYRGRFRRGKNLEPQRRTERPCAHPQPDLPLTSP